MDMATPDLSHIEPFETCSIRPPTENCSLTFRLTRNCYWNRCVFCPVYKYGARFSRRRIEDVMEDIRRAKAIDDLISVELGDAAYSGGGYDRVRRLVERTYKAKTVAGHAPRLADDQEAVEEGEDERLSWFRSWFKEEPTLEDSFSHLLTWRMGGGETCFLGDSDGLILKTDLLSSVITAARDTFPTLTRFTVYGRTGSARQKPLADLKSFCAAGLHRVHFGLESGSDRVLRMVRKGVTRADHVEGCLKTREAGLSCSIYVMPGLGGAGLSEEHAHETAEVINAIAPDFVRIRTLEIFPGTPLERMAREGAFRECSEEEVVGEIRILLEEIEVPTEFMSDSASNLLDLFGRLPGDRAKLLGMVRSYLSLPEREKLVFSLNARLQSFVGQYGGLSEDLRRALMPLARNGRIEPSLAQDEDLARIIRLVRSKLMP